MQAASCQHCSTSAAVGAARPPSVRHDWPNHLLRPQLQQHGASLETASALHARRLSGSTASTSGACRAHGCQRRRAALRAVGDNSTGDSAEEFIELTYSTEVMPPGGPSSASLMPCHQSVTGMAARYQPVSTCMVDAFMRQRCNCQRRMLGRPSHSCTPELVSLLADVVAEDAGEDDEEEEEEEEEFEEDDTPDDWWSYWQDPPDDVLDDGHEKPLRMSAKEKVRRKLP